MDSTNQGSTVQGSGVMGESILLNDEKDSHLFVDFEKMYWGNQYN